MPTSSALLASGAPPSPFRRPRGFPRRALPWNKSSAFFPRGVRCLSRVLGLRLRPHAPSPVESPEGNSTAPEPRGSASRGVLAPTDASTPGAPFHHALPLGRTCGTGIATFPSVPSSGFLPLSTVLAARGSRRGPRRFAAFFHAARVPGTSLQSFPFPGSRTRSRGPILPCGFAFDDRRRRARRVFTAAFPVLLRADSLPYRTHPKMDPGRMSRDDGSLRSLVRSPRHAFAYRTYRPHPTNTGLAGKPPARPLRSLAPPGSPFCDDPSLGQTETARRCSPGILTLQSSLHHGSRSGLSRSHTRRTQGPKPHAPPGVQPSRLHSAT